MRTESNFRKRLITLALDKTFNRFFGLREKYVPAKD